MKDIKYVTYFKTDNTTGNRYVALAANNKSRYVSEVLGNINNEVVIISPVKTQNRLGYYKGKLEKIEDNIFLKTFDVFGVIFKKLEFLKTKYVMYQLERYILNSIKDGEKMIFYHSLGFYKLIKKLKKKKNIEVILEVEEIYTDLIPNEERRKKEFELFKMADKFIFVNKILNNKINNLNKPFCVSHGAYKSITQLEKKYTDNKVHVVYSGIIDSIKKGAYNAISAAKYLDDNYVIHIIGDGDLEDVNALKEYILTQNSVNKCQIIFDGLKTGEEYIRYIQKCHIGLSTQNSQGTYNDTSFPSKILTYLSNGLRVVTIDIPAVRNSDVGEILYYYGNNNGNELASAIKSVKMIKDYDSRAFVEKLNKNFEKELEVMLNDK